MDELEQGGFRENRDNYRTSMKLILLLCVTAVIFYVVFFLQWFARGEASYFATTASGRVESMHSLSQPIVTSTYLLQWASLATASVFNLHFSNFEDELQQSSGYFTVSGWRSFQNALQSSGFLKEISDNKLDSSAVVNGDPVIVQQTVISGRYTWVVQLPLLITFTSASTQEPLHYIVTLNIARVSTLDSSKGILINDIKVVRNPYVEAS